MLIFLSATAGGSINTDTVPSFMAVAEHLHVNF